MGKVIVRISKRLSERDDKASVLTQADPMLTANGQSRVLIVDDDVELCEMLSEYLSAEGFAVALATDGEAGLVEAQSGLHDIVILDVMLPARSGIEVLRSLRRTTQVPVIMLTARGDNIDRVVGLELGADDYVPKPCYPRELLARIRAILRRGEMPPARLETITNGPLKVDTAGRQASIAGKALNLTACEFDLLAILARTGGKILTKEELSLKVLGRVRQTYDRSVDVHISNLRQKIIHSGGTPLIETVRGVGYRLRGPQ